MPGGESARPTAGQIYERVIRDAGLGLVRRPGRLAGTATLGNVIGGVGIVALLDYGQIRESH